MKFQARRYLLAAVGTVVTSGATFMAGLAFFNGNGLLCAGWLVVSLWLAFLTTVAVVRA